jgi:uncharacterized DUF497 family protein
MPTVRIGEFEWDAEKDVPGRFVLIGLSPRLRLLFVVSAESGERIRIISARRASPRQRKLYSHGP